MINNWEAEMVNSMDTFDFKNKKVLVREDLNAPLDKDFKVTDDTRLKAAVPTIKKIISSGGSAIVMSHLGRPKNGPEEKFSLKHIIPVFSKLLGVPVKFSNDCIGVDAKEMATDLKPGEVLLLENTRFHKEEEKGDDDFAKQLGELGDVYVNDAFGTAHRAHASTAVIADYFLENNKLFGYCMQREIDNADRILKNFVRPFTVIIGGAKVSSKILIIERFLDLADNIIVGGAMAFTFIKAMGGKVGKSMVEDDKLDYALALIKKAEIKGVNLMLPVDVLAADRFDDGANIKTFDIRNIDEGWMGMDIGPSTVYDYTQVIRSSKTILWNGPMGVFEFSNFNKGTHGIAQAVAEATSNGAYSLVGGGDSVAALNQLGLSNKVSYVSTGGGALLEYFEGKELPGIKSVLFGIEA